MRWVLPVLWWVIFIFWQRPSRVMDTVFAKQTNYSSVSWWVLSVRLRANTSVIFAVLRSRAWANNSRAPAHATSDEERSRCKHLSFVACVWIASTLMELWGLNLAFLCFEHYIQRPPIRDDSRRVSIFLWATGRPLLASKLQGVHVVSRWGD